MFLNRTGERFFTLNDQIRYEGLRGTLSIGPLQVPCLERGDNFMRIPPGTWTCEFRRMNNGTRAIRILEEGSEFAWASKPFLRSLRAGRIYIHPANWPWELGGCVAPGLAEIKGGVSDSRAAFAILCRALGGWKEGARFKMAVA